METRFEKTKFSSDPSSRAGLNQNGQEHGKGGISQSISPVLFWVKFENTGEKLKNPRGVPWVLEFGLIQSDGAKEIRTPDLFIANEPLYQLSYGPACAAFFYRLFSGAPGGWFSAFLLLGPPVKGGADDLFTVC